MKAIITHELEQMGYVDGDDALSQMMLLQQLFAQTYTFDNLEVLLNNKQPIDEELLIDQILIKKRGGLCYELNGTLYLVLKALGFDIELGSATVWSENGWIIDRTHTVILFYQNDQMYLLDSGSGTNLAIEPLQLDGDSVRSPVGIFRLRTKTTERGTIISEKLTKDGWKLRYAFYPNPVGFNDLNRIQKMIHDHPESPFNQTLLIAKTLKDGTVSITDRRVNRKWINHKGLEIKEKRIEFTSHQELLDQVKKYSSDATYEAVKIYLKQLIS